MPSYKLHYFDARGSGEIIRLTFHAAGVSFEDVRIGSEWPRTKDSYPTQQLPVLEIDNKMKVPQSASIARYIAATSGLFGKTDIEHLLVDALVETYKDLTAILVKFLFEKDEAKKAELKTKFFVEDVPKSFKNLESLLCRNKGGDGFFIGDGLTLADLQAMNVADMVSGMHTGCLKAFPKLAAHCERVRCHPRIAAYLKVRPKSEINEIYRS